MRRVLDNLITSVVVITNDLRIESMNPAAEMLFGISARQVQGLLFTELVQGTETMLLGMRECLNSGHAYSEHELLLTRFGQQNITVDCSVSPLFEPGLDAALLVELRQVDQQLRINREEQLLAQQQVSQALVRNLAHEIKNPLGGLRGAAQLLERELNGGDLREYTQIIIGEADRLRNLVDRMLGPRKLPNYQPVNVHQVLERVRNLVSAESGPGIVILQDYDPSIPPFMGDAEQLIQALLNIVRNAVQALSGNEETALIGPVQGTITLRSRVLRQCSIGLKKHKLVLQLQIIDNGPGIPVDIQEDIFFPTITSRAQGTGLGLSIAQSIVNQHGGLVECESQPGETVFTLLLPLERAKTDD